MRNIFLIGAGKSTSSLIKYLIDNAQKENWQLTIGDIRINHLGREILEHPAVRAIEFDAFNEQLRENEIKAADIVISMLLPRYHIFVARDCLKFKKHLITASYVSDEIKQLDQEAREAGLVFMNEIGLDPGIDHMSAMKVINEIRESGAEITGFESFTGGLLAPESEKDNPWRYKFTWNPKNVILAAQGGAAKFIEKGKYKYIPYHKIFRRTEMINIEDYGKFIGYANRDSLSYIPLYGL
jgi:saccharopine dehydrogenase-like NADP-dependent oxidoreductase